jgi:iron(III) transport system substrate-binding protein
MKPQTVPWRMMLVLILAMVQIVLLSSCQPKAAQVVIYTSVDQNFSEPILQYFEDETGIEVLAVYDVEAAKTTGLVNRLIAEKGNPQADVFWNGEFAQTIVLRDEGVLTPYASPNAADIPAAYKDPEDYWTGFGGRARVFIVNTDLVSANQMPTSIEDLLDPGWPKEQVGIAYPLFGTTATQVAALYAHWGPEAARAYFEALADRDIQVVDGNSVIRDMVTDGRLAFGLTDTDDACGAVDRGAPVAIVVPDQGTDQMGTLVIPNTVGLIAGGPNPEIGKQLIDYLLSDAVAEALIESGWSHVPLGGDAAMPGCMEGQSIRGMDVALDDVYEEMASALDDMTVVFVR